jgi:2-phospho-L-lactate guanylyltransferase (CobY/MobA/RfbA family)
MIVVVPVDPPRTGLVLSSLADRTPITEAQAATLYEAAVVDVLRAVATSGGELLVNYRDAETLPDSAAGGDPAQRIRDLAESALADEDLGDVRFERQVGSTRSARIGNTVTHLLEREEVANVGVLEPTAPLVARTEIDGAAMSLRRHDVVLGPSSGGRTYFAGFGEPIDFTDAYAVPELATLAELADDDGLGIGFAPMLPTIATESGLCATIAGIQARAVGNRPGAPATASVVEELGLGVSDEGSLEWK